MLVLLCCLFLYQLAASVHRLLRDRCRTILLYCCDICSSRLEMECTCSRTTAYFQLLQALATDGLAAMTTWIALRFKQTIHPTILAMTPSDWALLNLRYDLIDVPGSTLRVWPWLLEELHVIRSAVLFRHQPVKVTKSLWL